MSTHFESMPGRREVPPPSLLPPDVEAGQAVYGPLVLDLTSSVFWGCSKQRMQTHYDRHLSSRHCDIGVGTGYFLDHGRFPVRNPSITLVDLNERALGKTARRIQRYSPTRVRANVLEPLPLAEGTFGSVGMNFLLHCVPGAIERKGRTVFGSHELCVVGVVALFAGRVA